MQTGQVHLPFKECLVISSFFKCFYFLQVFFFCFLGGFTPVKIISLILSLVNRKTG